jgi:hypothetical protein
VLRARLTSHVSKGADAPRIVRKAGSPRNLGGAE